MDTDEVPGMEKLHKLGLKLGVVEDDMDAEEAAKASRMLELMFPKTKEEKARARGLSEADAAYLAKLEEELMDKRLPQTAPGQKGRENYLSDRDRLQYIRIQAIKRRAAAKKAREEKEVLTEEAMTAVTMLDVQRDNALTDLQSMTDAEREDYIREQRRLANQGERDGDDKALAIVIAHDRARAEEEVKKNRDLLKKWNGNIEFLTKDMKLFKQRLNDLAAYLREGTAKMSTFTFAKVKPSAYASHLAGRLFTKNWKENGNESEMRRLGVCSRALRRLYAGLGLPEGSEIDMTTAAAALEPILREELERVSDVLPAEIERYEQMIEEKELEIFLAREVWDYQNRLMSKAKTEGFVYTPAELEQLLTQFKKDLLEVEEGLYESAKARALAKKSVSRQRRGDVRYDDDLQDDDGLIWERMEAANAAAGGGSRDALAIPMALVQTQADGSTVLRAGCFEALVARIVASCMSGIELAPARLELIDARGTIAWTGQLLSSRCAPLQAEVDEEHYALLNEQDRMLVEPTAITLGEKRFMVLAQRIRVEMRIARLGLGGEAEGEPHTVTVQTLRELVPAVAALVAQEALDLPAGMVDNLEACQRNIVLLFPQAAASQASPAQPSAASKKRKGKAKDEIDPALLAKFANRDRAKQQRMSSQPKMELDIARIEAFARSIATPSDMVYGSKGADGLVIRRGAPPKSKKVAVEGFFLNNLYPLFPIELKETMRSVLAVQHLAPGIFRQEELQRGVMRKKPSRSKSE